MAICVGRNAFDGTSVIAERQDLPRGRGAQRGLCARGNPFVAGVQSEVQVVLTGSLQFGRGAGWK